MSQFTERNRDSQVVMPRNSGYEAVTASATLLRKNTGKTYTNIGATGTVTLTLPQDAIAGDQFTFLRAASYSFRIDPGAAGGIYAFVGYTWAKQADNKYLEITLNGGSVTLVADGNGDWVTTSVTDSLGFDIET